MLSRYVQRMRQSPFVRATALLAGSTALGQGLIVAVTPVLTRLYTPEDFGVLAVYVSILTLFLSIASLRYEYAVPLPRQDLEAVNLLAVGIGLLLLMCILCVAGIYVGGEALMSWTETPALRGYLWLLPLSLFGAGLYQLFSYWALREKAYGLIGRTRLTQSLSMLATQLGLGVALPGATGLVVGDVIGRSGGGGSLLRSFLAHRRLLHLLDYPTMCAVAYRYRRFPMISSGASLLNTLSLQLPNLLMAALYGPFHAGLFILAVRIGGLPVDLISQAIGQAYVGQTSEAVRHGKQDQVYNLTKKIVVQMTLLSAVLIIVSIMSPLLFGYIFGSEWQEAGWYLAFLAPMLAGRLTMGPISQIVNIAERQGVQVVGDALRCGAVAVAILTPSSLGLSASSAVIAYSATMTMSYVGFLGVYMHIARTLPNSSPQHS